jgi:NAD(P)-dependent dehydrogenase (short-subunit alcohol dehydrogenase family)
MASTLRFDGQVAVITGAGRGIGAAHAQLLAARGARVVVNDIGGAIDGSGADAGLAAGLVEQIRRAGGTAAADTSDISAADGAQALVDRAVAEFGRLDIVVNNAGVYWTDSFPGGGVAELRKQLAVHVEGSFNVTRAAWPQLRDAGAGRVVMTTSTGALGSAGLTAYGTAKAGVLGLGRALAVAGARHGIKVNLVAPMAMTRMMNAHTGEAEVPKDADRDPALVAPLVAVLCHRDCPVTGEAYIAGMRRVTRLVLAETRGYVHPSLDLTPEHLLANWDAINDPAGQQIRTDTMSWSDANNEVIGLARPGGAARSGGVREGR